MAHFKGKRYGCSCPDGTCDMNCRMYRIAAGKPSNADRIRAMTDEELAAWLADHPVVSEYDENNPQHKAWLEWLKMEVNDGRN